jgi:hypothetical protein
LGYLGCGDIVVAQELDGVEALDQHGFEVAEDGVDFCQAKVVVAHQKSISNCEWNWSLNL